MVNGNSPCLGPCGEAKAESGSPGLDLQCKNGIAYTYTSYSAHKRLDPTIGLQCSNILSEFTLEFYACKIGYSISLGWIRGYFHGELGQSNRQFQECTYACMECM